MSNIIRLILITLTMGACKEEVPSSISACYPSMKLSRGQKVNNAPVLVRLSGGLATGSQLIATNGVAWSSCNLPAEFNRDSLKIYVDGYFLTSPELELMNLTPLPFEVTRARLR